jgi:hypothetical protein
VKKTKSNQAKTSKKADAQPAERKQKSKGLMDMPPGRCNWRSSNGVFANNPGAEIRNRIYHFATERDDFEGWEDAVALLDMHAGHGCGRKQWPMSKAACYSSGRNFLGLTQTCKLLRREYRSIWLRTSSVRVRIFHLVPYIHTLYGCGSTEHTNLPKLVQISLNHDLIGEDDIDLTQMLRMRAACPTTRFEFIPHELTLDEGPWIDSMVDCDVCDAETRNGEMSLEEFVEHGCPHEYLHRAEYADYLCSEEYSYLLALNKLLAHDNPKWLKDIRDRDVARVKLNTSDGDYYSPELTIRLAHDSDIVTEDLSEKSMLEAAYDYVRGRDLRSTNCGPVALHFQIQICGGSH